ncbi:hypothetical protein KQY27_01730 [Methanobrevibacter sp. TMH8]|uniref:hypothetical protein n=1 Tax=Methanobrevibacter sp. TMH8 TaxID=2848611 RepID=UPI001CCAAD68|nr:hypothetical protein [Methanobrevibacter sp. TMH8]MBZ9570267.1 hypothetical protein [Methanobrevibacter sp. TMH8]
MRGSDLNQRHLNIHSSFFLTEIPLLDEKDSNLIKSIFKEIYTPRTLILFSKKIEYLEIKLIKKSVKIHTYSIINHLIHTYYFT